MEDIKIISYRLPNNTPDPSRHATCGWIALIDNEEVGWCNMTFLVDKTIKFEDAFIKPDQRGKGIYKKLWETRWNYVKEHFKGFRIIAYCKPITVNFYKRKGFIEKEIVTLVQNYL